MQTPIDFGKSFLNSFFDARDLDACQEDLAYDVVWITPEHMYHFLTAREVRDFLEAELGEKEQQGSQQDADGHSGADGRGEADSRNGADGRGEADGRNGADGPGEADGRNGADAPGEASGGNDADGRSGADGQRQEPGEQNSRKRQRNRNRYVDIVSIKSSPSASNVSTVAYEVNLVPREGDKVVYLRCSMVICRRGQHYEITFIHMSERFRRGDMEQIREFTGNLPCGVLIFAYVKAQKRLQTVFYNDYFWRKLRYKEDNFHKQMERDPFFMIAEEERDQLMQRLEEISGTNGHLALNVTFYRRDGNRFQYRMIGAPAYQDGENTAYYCVFQETTGFNMLHARMKEKVTEATEVVDRIPGGICVVAGETGDWHAVYVNDELQERTGKSAAVLADEIGRDPFSGLEMTGITHDRLVEKHLHLLSEDPYVGMFPMTVADGSKRWTDVYLVNSSDHKGNRLRMLVYYDKEEARQQTERRIEKAENASKIQQERAKAEIRQAQDKAQREIEEANTSIRKQIEEAQARTQEQIESFRVRMNKVVDSQKEAAEAKEKELQASYERKEQELQKSYENKEQLLEKQLENYRQAQQQEAAQRQKAADEKAMEYERSVQEKQSEIERLEQKLEQAVRNLRRSEEEREQERSAGALREQEQKKTVERLRQMVERRAQIAREQDTSGTDTFIQSQEHTDAGQPEPRRHEKPGDQGAGVHWYTPPAAAASEGIKPSGIRPEAGSRQETGGSVTGSGSTGLSGFRTGNALHELGAGISGTAENRLYRTGADISGAAENESGGTAGSSSVVDDLVNMAASDDGVLQEVRFSLDECLQNVMLLQEPVCREKNIDLELKESVSMPPEAIGDKAKLQRALVSLLESVMQQTPPGSRINLGCRADKASGNRVYLYFTVRDDGSNLASELMTGMFEKKSEKDDPLRAGLYTAREIISSMGGNVRVRSRRGQSTEFMIMVCMHLP